LIKTSVKGDLFRINHLIQVIFPRFQCPAFEYLGRRIDM